MLKGMNEQVKKHQEVLGELKDELEEYTHLMSLCERKEEGNNSASNIMVVKLLGKSAKVNGKISERQRMLDGKIERREEWLDGKRLVASQRAKKVRERLLRLSDEERSEIKFEKGMGLSDYLSTEGGLEELKELSDSAERKYKALVAMKELAFMVADVFDGEDELREADEDLLEKILKAFKES